jgi:hypothetical protein
MGSLTNYGENALMGHLFGTAYTPVATVYLALATADPTDAATGASMNEVANTGSYARKAITFGAAASRRVTQSGDVAFTAATGSWGTVTHWALVDSGTYGAGNVLAHGALGTSKSVVSGNTPTVPTTDVYVELTASGGIGTAVANKLLDLMFRNQAYAQPSTYAALTTATISDSTVAGSMSEVSGGSYARVLVNKIGGASPAWDTISGGATSNANAITFTTATGSWGTVTSAAIVSSSSGAGDVICYDNSNVVDQAVASGDTVQFAAGAFDVALS